MGYIANLYKYPISNFVDDIKFAGADAVLVVDAPHELKEENQLREALNKNGLSLISFELNLAVESFIIFSFIVPVKSLKFITLDDSIRRLFLENSTVPSSTKKTSFLLLLETFI